MGTENFKSIFTNLAIKGKKEKIKQRRENFFFYPVESPTIFGGDEEKNVHSLFEGGVRTPRPF